jgi:hypothetical protein
MNTRPNKKDEKGPPVIGVAQVVSCTDTRAKIVASPINVANSSNLDDVLSQTTMEGITPSLTTLKPVPTTGPTKGLSFLASMPRRNRLNNGNEPDAFGQDSLVRGMGH